MSQKDEDFEKFYEFYNRGQWRDIKFRLVAIVLFLAGASCGVRFCGRVNGPQETNQTQRQPKSDTAPRHRSRAAAPANAR